MDYQEVIERFKRGYLVDSNGDTTQKDFEALKIAISAMNELQQYKYLGTLEEVREAVEKQEEERPQKVLGIFGGEEYECKNCGSPVEYLDEYCRCCGQKQDWE